MQVVFENIDDWNRPIFKKVDGVTRFGLTDELFSYNEDESTVRATMENRGLTGKHLLVFGNHFNCEPLGGKPSEDIEIVWSVDSGKENTRKFDYMMLDRLWSDVKYYSGNGGKSPQVLYSQNEVEHYNEMEKLYNSFADSEKPEWFTLNDLSECKKLLGLS